ncbi:hypothetical protein [Thiomonas sp.]
MTKLNRWLGAAGLLILAGCSHPPATPISGSRSVAATESTGALRMPLVVFPSVLETQRAMGQTVSATEAIAKTTRRTVRKLQSPVAAAVSPTLAAAPGKAVGPPVIVTAPVVAPLPTVVSPATDSG